MLENLTKQIIENLIETLNTNENKELIRNRIFDPIIKEFQEKLKPYLSLMIFIYGLNLLLIILILILLFINKNK